MKYLLITLTLLCFVLNTYAQKIDNKKGITYVDEIPVLKLEDGSLVFDNKPVKVSANESGKLLFIITRHFYEKGGKTGLWYFEVRFADFDLVFRNAQDYKVIIKNLLETGALNKKAELSEDGIIKYIKLYSEDLP